MPESPSYTVFSMSTLRRQLAVLKDDMELPEVITLTNNPRLSLDETKPNPF